MTKKKQEEKKENNEQKEKEEDSQELNELKQKVEDLEKEKEDYLKGWKRTKANFQNYKKEEEKRLERTKTKALKSFFEELLPVLDSFDASLNQEKEKLEKKGVEMIRKQLRQTLSKFDLEEIEVERGDEFNTKKHEAVSTVKVEKLEDNKVAEVLEKGYSFEGQVLRAAKVKVSGSDS